MWIYSTLGFFSIVKHRHELGSYLVRARCRDDLASLLEAAGLPASFQYTPSADYPFRVTVPGNAFSRIMLALLKTVDYPNFKDASADVHPRRANMHHHIHAITADAMDVHRNQFLQQGATWVDEGEP